MFLLFTLAKVVHRADYPSLPPPCPHLQELVIFKRYFVKSHDSFGVRIYAAI